MIKKNVLRKSRFTKCPLHYKDKNLIEKVIRALSLLEKLVKL